MHHNPPTATLPKKKSGNVNIIFYHPCQKWGSRQHREVCDAPSHRQQGVWHGVLPEAKGTIRGELNPDTHWPMCPPDWSAGPFGLAGSVLTGSPGWNSRCAIVPQSWQPGSLDGVSQTLRGDPQRLGAGRQ